MIGWWVSIKIPYECTLGELVKVQPKGFTLERYIDYVNPYMLASEKVKE